MLNAYYDFDTKKNIILDIMMKIVFTSNKYNQVPLCKHFDHQHHLNISCINLDLKICSKPKRCKFSVRNTHKMQLSH